MAKATKDREGCIGAAQICVELARRYPGKVPSYMQIWRSIITGRVPSERIDDRWYLRIEDLPKVAEHFGLEDRAAA